MERGDRRRHWDLFILVLVADGVVFEKLITCLFVRCPAMTLPYFSRSTRSVSCTTPTTHLGSIYPWDWVGDDEASFRALTGGLLVAPILQQLILNRAPIEVLEFADAVAKWPFRRIVPAHLKNDLQYTGKDYRAAFSFLEAQGPRKGLPRPLAADMALLVESEQGLLASGAVARCPPLPGGAASREEILKQTVYGCRGDVCAPRSSP